MSDRLLIEQLKRSGEICTEAMTEMADLYSSPEIPEHYRIKIKHLCELKMADIQRTCSFWARELEPDSTEGN